MSVEDGIEIAKLAFRAPPFWKADVELWFLQVEANFKTAGITCPKTQFHFIVSALDMEVLSYVRDLVKSPPPENPYDALKSRIISQFMRSEDSRLRTLLQDLQLGDLRPSELLHKMRVLAESKISDEILKTLWFQRLPRSMQQILSISSDSLEKLSEIADKINEISDLNPDVSVVRKNSDHVNTTEIQELKTQILALTEKVDRLGRSRSRDRFEPRNRSRSNGRNKKVDKPYCWYHFKFGKNAKKCLKPCTFSENC